MRAFLLPVVLSFGLAPGLPAAVLLVDAQGGAPYTSIQAAVAAAADGDVVLVKSGTYGPVTIQHEGVSVVADAGAVVQIDGGIHVVDTLVHHRILLRGLVATGSYQAAGAVPEGLRIDVARGAVRVEDCTFLGSDGPDYTFPSFGAAGARADVALDLSLVRCVMRGGDGGLALTGGLGSAGGHGMIAVRSKLALHDCELSGGTPADADELGDGAPGGHGLVADDGSTLGALPMLVFAAGTTFVGSDGSIDAWCIHAGNGGHGALLGGGQTQAWFLDCDFQPGKKGACGGIWPGLDGVDVQLDDGASHAILPGTARGLVATSPVREQQTLALEVGAAPLDGCFLLVAVDPLWQLELVVSGVLLTGPPYVGGLVPLGTAPASGTFVLGIPVPLLPAGVGHATVRLQGAFADPGGAWWLGGPATPLVLDSSF